VSKTAVFGNIELISKINLIFLAVSVRAEIELKRFLFQYT